MIESPKKALYAAVGAPLAFGKKVSEHFSDRYTDTNTRISEARSKFITDIKAEFETWVTEGENLVQRVSDRTVVEDISERVHVDQFQEQVGKLRHQLEDMLESWRTNFLPEKEEAAPVEKITVKAATKPAAKKPAAKKPAAKTATKPAAKTAAKKPAAKKPAAKTATKPAAKTAAKKPAAKKATK